MRGRGIPHGDIEVVLTICEESGLAGAKHFDTGRLRARRGLVLDVDGVSELITRAPGANRLAFTVHGLAAHAGICPEEGLSAIQMAAEAISAMRLGRLDAETTANLGVIEGGLATNIVPDRVVVRGETRSLSPAKLEAQTEAMRRCFLDVAARRSVRVGGREHRARVEVDVHHQYDRLEVPDHAGIVALVQARRGRDGPRLPHEVDGRGIRRQRLRGARDRGRQSRVRHAGDPHGERVGRPPRPGADGGAGRGDGPAQRGRVRRTLLGVLRGLSPARSADRAAGHGRLARRRGAARPDAGLFPDALLS